MIPTLIAATIVCCPVECGPKWMAPRNMTTTQTYGDTAWQMCVVLKNIDPRTCKPCDEKK